jgi:ADP-heptose:LPS heptosyltransferase
VIAGVADFRNILLIKMSSLGDVVHALPTLCALRQRFPSAKISWLVDARYEALLRGHPCLDEIIVAAGPTFRSPMRIEHIVRATFQYRVAPALYRRHFDLVVDLQGLFRTGVLTVFPTPAKARRSPIPTPSTPRGKCTPPGAI